MTTPDRRPVTQGLMSTLRRATSMPVGLGEAPAHEDDEPYLVVHAIPGGGLDGPWSAPDADAAVVYQIDAVGQNYSQAEWAGDTVRRTMLARNADGSFQVEFGRWQGSKVIQRTLEGSPSGVTPEGTGDFKVFSVQERYVLHITPD